MLITIPTERQIRRYGAKPDIPDIRDHHVERPALRVVRQLPKSVALYRRRGMISAYDQGYLGSCVANAVGGACEYTLRELRLAAFTPSRLAIYYGARKLEGTQDSDSGAYIRDGIKVVAKQGAGDERLWKYDIERFTEEPPLPYAEDASQHLVTEYARVEQNRDAIRAVLAAGDPVVFGIGVYESFESDRVAATGTVPMPKTSEALMGWHAIWMDGYGERRTDQLNSWSPGWGNAGRFSLPWDYVLDPNLADDFWRVTLIKGTPMPGAVVDRLPAFNPRRRKAA